MILYPQEFTQAATGKAIHELSLQRFLWNFFYLPFPILFTAFSLIFPLAIIMMAHTSTRLHNDIWRGMDFHEAYNC